MFGNQPFLFDDEDEYDDYSWMDKNDPEIKGLYTHPNDLTLVSPALEKYLRVNQPEGVTLILLDEIQRLRQYTEELRQEVIDADHLSYKLGEDINAGLEREKALRRQISDLESEVDDFRNEDAVRWAEEMEEQEKMSLQATRVSQEQLAEEYAEELDGVGFGD